MQTTKRLALYLKGRWGGYLLGGGYQVFSEAILQVIMAGMLKFLVDAALAGDLNLLLKSVFVTAGAMLLLTSIIPFASRLFNGSLEDALLALRTDLFLQIQDLPMSYHETHHSGDMVARLTNDAEQAKEVLGIHLFKLAETVASVLAGIIVLGFVHWALLMVALVVSILPIIVNHLTAPGLRAAGNQVQAEQAVLGGKLKDILVGMPVIRTFNLQTHFIDDYTFANQKTRDLGINMAKKQSLNVVSNSLLSSSIFLSIMVVGGYLIAKGELTVGDAVAATQLCNAIANPLQNLGNTWVALQRALGSADRVLAVLDESKEELLLPAKDEPSVAADNSMVHLHGLSFAYNGNDKVLKELNLDVATGSVVALAGPSGGGKSTIFKLLLGFYSATEGECYLSGRPLWDYSLDELREMSAYVPQESYLFAGTIRENITYGKPDAPEEEVMAASKAANAHQFIVDLPAGYETQVGERGAQLSGGQRQRIAIARALLKDAPLLLLDEATSSLDSEAEQLVQEALERLMENRTTLIIAHRLSTIEKADCIHVVAEGKIQESGTHEELLARDGIYRRLYNLSAG